MSYKKLWIALGMVMVVSFAVLGGVGIKILTSAPPIPSQVLVAWRRGPIRRRRHSGWTRRLAIHRRPGGWHHLGPRILRGAGLVGRLAASRMHVRPRPLGSGGGRLELCGARCGTAGGPPGAAPAADADQYLRPGHQRHRHRSHSRRSLRGSRPPLRRCVLKRPQ